MKTSLLTALLILALAALITGARRGEIGTLHEERQRLVARADELGLSLLGDDTTHPTSGPPENSRANRQDQDEEAMTLAREVIAMMIEIQTRQKNGEPLGTELEEHMLQLLQRLVSLNARQSEILIGQVADSTELSDDDKRGLVNSLIWMMAEDHPQAALALLTNSPGLLGNQPTLNNTANNLLSFLARDNPYAAIDWLEQNAATFPGLSLAEAHASIVGGAAANDPALAFKLIEELGLKNDVLPGHMLFNSEQSEDARDAALSAVRAQLEKPGNDAEKQNFRQSAFLALGEELAKSNFETASAWLDQAALTPEERAEFAAGLTYHNTRANSAKWIGWLSQNLPEQKAAEHTASLVREWTTQNHTAAGNWITSAPDGPAKHAAIHAYAETVAPYDQDTAVQWVKTLPAGTLQTNALKAIHRSLAKDPEAAAAFAAEHGID